MTTYAQSRQPRGTAIGGQFAAHRHAEPGELADAPGTCSDCGASAPVGDLSGGKCALCVLSDSINGADSTPVREDVRADGGRQGRIVTQHGITELLIQDQHTGEWASHGSFDTPGQARTELVKFDQAQDGSLVYGSVGPIKRTPWGEPQHVEETAPGIVQVSTAGHGGIKLSPERNRLIPPALRNPSGWYEEDAESHIVAMVHPEGFIYNRQGDMDEVRASAVASVKDWFPDKYEKATGETIPVSESYMKRKAAEQADKASFRAAHRDEFVGTQRTNTHARWLPATHAVAWATKDATGEERAFLVPCTEAVKDGSYVDNLVIDPNRHIDVTDIATLGNRPEVKPELIHDIGVSFDGLTEKQRERAEAELSKRYRFPDGSVGTIVDAMRKRGVTGKQAVAFSNRPSTSYIVSFEGGAFQDVSQAAWKALDIPDTTTDRDRVHVELANLTRRLDIARRDVDIAAFRKLNDQAEAAKERLRDITEAEAAQWPNEAEKNEMRRQALQTRLAENGIDIDDLRSTSEVDSAR